MASQTAAEALDRLGPAHEALLRQSDLQFKLSVMAPPKPSPFWEWLAKLLEPAAKAASPVAKFLAPAAPYVFWTGVALGVGFILFLIVQRLLVARREVVLGGLKLSAGAEPWRPAPEQARALLEEADRLAGEGRFVEAAHLILLRSIQDIQARRPRAVRISLTSRDIARLEAVPGPARTAFSFIAGVVEASFFGGRPVGREEFGACRKAYEDFAFPEVWA